MAKAVWKFPLGKDWNVTLKMPKRAEIVAVQSQFEEGMLWAIVNEENDSEDRRFVSVGTSEPFENEGKKYVGTYQVSGGNYVIHVFEIIEPV